MTKAQRSPLSEIEAAMMRRTKQLRLAKPYSRQHLASLLGVGYETYKSWENRNPMPLDHVDRFCALVGCSIEYLLTGRDAPRGIGRQPERRA